MIKSNSLDFIVSNQVIEYIYNHEKVISEAFRILQKKGIFYISTVFKKWYGWYFYRSNGRWVLDPTHVREYKDTNDLMLIINNIGFKVIKEKRV